MLHNFSAAVFAVGVEKESGSDLLVGDDCLFLISSLIHFPIGSSFHWIIDPFFIVLMTQSSMTRWLNSSMIQFFQQPLGLLQIFGVKSFSEPVVDF